MNKKMKKINLKKVVIAAIILSCGTVANAQNDTKHEISVGVGAGSTSSILNSMSDFVTMTGTALTTSAMTGGAYTGYVSYRDTKTIPTINVEYIYHLNKVVGIGGAVSFNSFSKDMYCTWQNNTTNTSEEQKVGDAKKTNISIMPVVKFDYIRKDHFGLYSKVAAGVTYMHEKETQDISGQNKEVNSKNEYLLNFHVTLLGAEFGSKNFRGFTELGFGEQGIAQIGLRYKF